MNERQSGPGEGDEFPTQSAGSEQPARLPEQVGAYRILAKLGEGGFGIVYAAEQTAPVRRRVALKIIKPGMDSAAVLARFAAERQALAVMDHPCVAKVYDGGTTPEGRPFFVMDLVQGLAITEHCDRHRLGLSARIELFIQVCHAVQHAHMKGVIHRDLKPSNILVEYVEGPDGPRPTPKVIDFGVAKALNQRLAERTVFTELGLMIGTPAYMSPEQAEMSGQDIDTRADIYSLGVVLYELLAGVLPFDGRELRGAGFAEIQRIVREVDPPKPSARLSTARGTSARASGRESSADESPGAADVEAIARQRRTDARALLRSLRGDLDWVVMKCLEKDRARRYDTANALAAELRRYLHDEPVLAGPPSTAYRLRKFVRRNRGPVAAAAALLVVFVGGAVGITLALAEAQRRGAELAQVVEFQASQLADIDTALMGARLRGAIVDKRRVVLARADADPGDVERGLGELEASLAGVNFTNVALESLDANIFERALQTIRERFTGQPLVQAQLLQTVAHTMDKLGLRERGTAPQKEALAIRERLLGPEHPETLASVAALVDLLHGHGRIEEVESLAHRVLDGRRRRLGAEHPDTLKSLYQMTAQLVHQGRYVEAESYAQQALDARRRVLGDRHPDTLDSLRQMGMVLARQRNRAEAEAYTREALDRSRRLRGDEHPDTIGLIRDLGELLLERNRIADADEYLRQALAMSRRVHGDEHQATLTAMALVSALLERQGKPAAAEEMLRQAMETGRRVLGEAHESTLRLVHEMAGLLWRQKRYAEAEPLVQNAMEAARRTLGNEDGATLTAVEDMGYLRQLQGRHADAEPLMREVLETRGRVLGAAHPSTSAAVGRLGRLLMQQKRFDEAEPLIREAVELGRKQEGNEHDSTVARIIDMASLLRQQGKDAEAEVLMREVVETRRRVLGGDHQLTLTAVANFAGMLSSQGRHAEAEPYRREVLEVRRRLLGDENVATLAALNLLAVDLSRQGKKAEAERYYHEGLETARRALGSEHEATVAYTNNLGSVLRELGRFDEAEPLLAEALRLSRATRPVGHSTTGITLTQYGQTLTALGRHAEAEKALLEANTILAAAFGAEHERTKRAVEGLVELYDAWHLAAPAAGHKAMAEKWRRMQEAVKR